MLCERCQKAIPVDRIVITKGKDRLIINPWDVIAIEATKGGAVFYPMGMWEEVTLLKIATKFPQFYQVSRKWLVQPSLVTGARVVEDDHWLKVGGMDVPVSRAYWPSVARRFGLERAGMKRFTPPSARRKSSAPRPTD